ncbi:MAG: hypothetical protein KGL95_05370 [Patescibacteria group bacterium]|nr:hypothetical protein [Patescibacteria group bacterium]
MKYVGKDVIIGKTVRFRHPQFCSIDDFSIIDDFAYISTKFKMGTNSHISSHLTIGGGVDYMFEMGDLSSLSAGVKIWCSTDDYVNDIIAVQAKHVKDKIIGGDVVMKDFTGVGANSVILPNTVISEGSAVGALSLVLPNSILKPWVVYAGIPAKPIKKRNKENVLLQARRLNYKI